MRKYTLVFSIVVHAIAVAAVIIVSALATDNLPEPRRTSAFIIVRPELPQPAPPNRRSRSQTPLLPAPVPLAPPESVQRETIAAPADFPGFDTGALSTGIPVGEVLSSADFVPPPPAPSRPKEPVRVGGRIDPPKRLIHVTPIYPPIAIAARKEGTVILEALISEDGTVRDVRVLRPEPVFEQAAIAAVRQWRFSPTLLNGEPVPVVMTVTVGFTLNR